MKVELHEHVEQERRCPFCHDALGDEETWSCPRCGTVHHLECAHENGKCAELGCGGALPVTTPRPRAPRRARAQPVADGAWTPERSGVRLPWPGILALWAIGAVLFALFAERTLAVVVGSVWILAFFATIAARAMDWILAGRER